MSLDTLPEKVRQSALSCALADKLFSPQPVDFDYWGEFKRLRDRVSAHVGEMKVLFPWFTPHDEEHHLGRLFGIADKMLSPERYARMNAAELFLLACGLYAHDWGMAMGPDEITHIRGGAVGDVSSDVFTPLDDESERLREFAEKQGLRPTKPGEFPGLDDDHLRAYIRHTHAWRSGVRARAFFKVVGASLPQALERVCQGHWLDFSDLDDELRFSAQFGVLGYSVNLRAIALYIRLVDLFDIANDRTPYAIWRFVAPRDPRSRMEWSKHRALSPVTFPQYGDGRAVRFDGSTSDPEVWAELEDLRDYCENQLAGTNDLLARHRDERHQLDLRRIDWAVTAERFKPVNIRFEFHRQRMFEILADEIYQGDSHVFLRELLQNSIDAIRMRREMVRRRAASSGARRDFGLGFDDAIYFTAEHGADGDTIVRCRDFGIGMDEYVIRNYLAVAGVSYYQSDEFRHLGLKMDPVSRFGIGILSCFMVAERIEIETMREPHLSSDTKPLRMDIPAVDRQFRVFPGQAATDIGTIVTVHVRGAKLRTDVRSEGREEMPLTSPRLQVTEYLAAVAGFVEFPIVVDENGRRTVIQHPDRSASEAEVFAREGEAIEVRQLSRDYPWDEMFLPQDAADAAKVLQPRIFDLHQDLGLAGYEGTLTYLVPQDEECEYEESRSYNRTELGLIFGAKHIEEKGRVTLRTPRDFSHYKGVNKTGIAPSCRRSPVISVFRDGLLLADAPNPRRDDQVHYSCPPWPLPALRINLPKRLVGSLDVARRTLIGGVETWDTPVWHEVMCQLRDNEVAQALHLEPSKRLRRLAMLANIYRLRREEVMDIVPRESWPCPTLTCEGAVAISNLPFQLGKSFYKAPEELEFAILYNLGWAWELSKVEKRTDMLLLLSQWRGGEAFSFGSSMIRGIPERLWMRFTDWRYKIDFVPIGVRFLGAPLPGFAPLPQVEFACVDPSVIDTDGLLESAISDPLRLDEVQRCALRNPRLWSFEIDVITDAAPFAPPFANCFAWGGRFLNLKHPTTCALLRCAAGLQLHSLRQTRPPEVLGRVRDILITIANRDLELPDTLQKRLAELWVLVKRHDLIEIREQPPFPKNEDYVWGSLNDLYERVGLHPNHPEKQKWSVFQKYLRPFGHVLTDATPEELPSDLDAALPREE